MDDARPEILVECPKCASLDFCVTKEFPSSFSWVRCRQCNTPLSRLVDQNEL